MGEVVVIPEWMLETPPRFRAFDDGVTGEIIVLPVVRVERTEENPPKNPPHKIRIEEPT